MSSIKQSNNRSYFCTGYSFQACHPDLILTYFDIQYPDDMSFELDSTSKDFVAGVRFYVNSIVKMHLLIKKC